MTDHILQDSGIGFQFGDIHIVVFGALAVWQIVGPAAAVAVRHVFTHGIGLIALSDIEFEPVSRSTPYAVAPLSIIIAVLLIDGQALSVWSSVPVHIALIIELTAAFQFLG